MRKISNKLHWVLLAIAAAIAAMAIESLDAQENRQVLVLGGTRNTGFETVKILLNQGHGVTVMVRSTSDLSNLETTTAKTVVGDAFDKASIDSALRTGPYWAVISNLSGKTPEGRYVDGIGNVNAIEAAEDSGVDRFILVSTIGAGESVNAVPVEVQKILGHIFAEKERAEELLISSTMDYTIIRPGGLYDGPPSGTAKLAEETNVYGRIARGEVARLTVEALNDIATIGKIYSVVDPDS